MSTRSVIGIIRKDGSLECINCYRDGYLHGVGKVLSKHYSDQEKIEQLLELGDLYALKENTEPKENTNHTIINPDKYTTIAYVRDGKEMNTQSKVFDSIEEFQYEFNNSWCEYAYLFDETKQKWYCNTTAVFDAKSLEELSLAVKNEMNESMDYGMKFN